jgi:hypothetical protein
MKQRAIVVGLLSATLASPAGAKCIYHPEIRATVTVDGCVAVTLGASGSRYILGDEEWGPRYRAGATLSGTLISVSVKSARFTWPGTSRHFVNGVRLWVKGESRSLFVKKAAADVCPAALPTDITVQSQRICCDTVPGDWECLLPRAVALVEVVATK